MKKIFCLGNVTPVVTEEDLNKLFGFKTTSYLQKTCQVELTVPHHVFKSKPIKIEYTKVKPKTRSKQYKISGNSYNPVMQKQQICHQQHQSQYQQLKSKHQAQQKENKKDVSKTSQDSESLITVSDERSYKDTLITQKKNVVIFGDSMSKGINKRLLNKKLIKPKVVCKFFPGATSKDLVHYIKPTLQENELDTSILHMGVNDVLRLGFNIDTVSKDIINIANHCKKFSVKQIIILGLILTTRLNASFMQYGN